jgi:tripartite-type tricarboxylate transporter receptor subunit TctC
VVAALSEQAFRRQQDVAPTVRRRGLDAARGRFLPEVPTFTELGYKPLEMVEWYGFFLPGKAGPDTVQRAAAAVAAAMNAPDMAEALAPYGLEVAVTGPAQLAQAVKSENAAWAPIVKRVGFTPES